jgi:ParB family transcriptional regulator, chromosome partitioning protein
MSDRAKRPPLGRGLAALFGEAGTRLSGEPGGARPGGAQPGGAQTVPIEAIRPSPFQPRRRFAEEELEGLAQSIREKGIVQPLLVRPIADSEALEIALVENLQREDLSPLEEAEAYSRLTREFGRSQAGLAEAVGKSRSHVANTLRLLGLPAPVRKSLEEGALTAGHARALLGAPDPATLAREVVRRGLNVRATETLVRRRAAQPQPRKRPTRDADSAVLEQELATTLGLRVTLAPKRRGGSLTVHYASLDQLDRVLELLRRG